VQAVTNGETVGRVDGQELNQLIIDYSTQQHAEAKRKVGHEKTRISYVTGASWWL